MRNKSKLLGLLSLLLFAPAALAACGAPAESQESPETASENTLSIADGVMVEVPVEKPGEETEMHMQITVGDQTFTAVLEDNAATQSFLERLPVTIDMTELNGNEKYYYFDEGFPANPSSVGHIHAGDLMLYGSDCLVLFYKDHSSGYAYTRLGAVEDPEGLAQAVGGGNVTVTWEKRGG